jgi:hypothetical protein
MTEPNPLYSQQGEDCLVQNCGCGFTVGPKCAGAINSVANTGGQQGKVGKVLILAHTDDNYRVQNSSFISASASCKNRFHHPLEKCHVPRNRVI